MSSSSSSSLSRSPSPLYFQTVSCWCFNLCGKLGNRESLTGQVDDQQGRDREDSVSVVSRKEKEVVKKTDIETLNGLSSTSTVLAKQSSLNLSESVVLGDEVESSIEVKIDTTAKTITVGEIELEDRGAINTTTITCISTKEENDNSLDNSLDNS